MDEDSISNERPFRGYLYYTRDLFQSNSVKWKSFVFGLQFQNLLNPSSSRVVLPDGHPRYHPQRRTSTVTS